MITWFHVNKLAILRLLLQLMVFKNKVVWPILVALYQVRWRYYHLSCMWSQSKLQTIFWICQLRHWCNSCVITLYDMVTMFSGFLRMTFMRNRQNILIISGHFWLIFQAMIPKATLKMRMWLRPWKELWYWLLAMASYSKSTDVAAQNPGSFGDVQSITHSAKEGQSL